MREKDFISIILPVYNCEKTLIEAIESIIGQTYPHWQLVACDDCSTDESYHILEAYKEKLGNKMILLRNERNSRIAFTLNHCLQYCNGAFVARMDGDDISMPERLEKQISFLKKHPEYDLVGCQMISFDENGEHEIKRGKEVPSKMDLRTRTPFAHATIMCHAYVYKKLQGYTISPDVIRCEDVDLWFRFFENDFKGYNLQIPLYKVREDAESFKRRSFQHSAQASKVLFRSFRRMHYPLSSYIFIMKPLVSVLLPEDLKRMIRNQRNKKQ